MRRHVDEFASTTSMHGAPKVISSTSPTRRRVWLVLFLAAWLMFAGQMYLVLDRYFTYPIKVVTSVQRGGVPFPSITLCNARQFDPETLVLINSMLNEISTADKKDDFQLSKFYETLVRFEKISNALERYFYKFTQFVSYFNLYLGELLGYNIPDSIDPSYLGDEGLQLQALSESVDQSLLEKLSNRMDSFLVTGRFKNSKNSDWKQQFTATFNRKYYKCFTYKSPEAAQQQLTEKYPPIMEGHAMGWAALVFTGDKILTKSILEKHQDFEATNNFRPNENVGAKVIIHPPDTTPDPYSEGYDIQPGQSAAIDLHLKTIERVGYPYGQCTYENPFDKRRKGYTYRQKECIGQCVQMYIIEQCGCFDSSLPLPLEQQHTKSDVLKENSGLIEHQLISCKFVAIQNDPRYKFLDVIRRVDNYQNYTFFYKAVSKYWCGDVEKVRAYENSTLLSDCGCNPPCLEFLYDTTYSPSRLSDRVSVNTNNLRMVLEEIRQLFDFFEDSFDSGKMKNDILVFVWDNASEALKDFSQINVYTSDSNVMKMQESPDYVLVQLISDIGGQLGIWIGVSVLTLSEFFEMCLFIVRDAVRRLLTMIRNSDEAERNKKIRKEEEIEFKETAINDD